MVIHVLITDKGCIHVLLPCDKAYVIDRINPSYYYCFENFNSRKMMDGFCRHHVIKII